MSGARSAARRRPGRVVVVGEADRVRIVLAKRARLYEVETRAGDGWRKVGEVECARLLGHELVIWDAPATLYALARALPDEPGAAVMPRDGREPATGRRTGLRGASSN